MAQKILSLVPSWTETLIECGLEVVCRTRFCIHPEDKVKGIPAIGGTKQANWTKAKTYSPDIAILDREENTKEMAENCPFKFIDTHVTSIESVATEIEKLAKGLEAADKLNELARRWKKVALQSEKKFSWEQIPAFIEWINPIDEDAEPPKKILYMIWKDPWMTVAKDTFIGSVLSKLGMGEYFHEFDTKYPEIDLVDYDPRDTLLLFSSEPYPFGREIEELKAHGFPAALVDGEKLSWFGIRSLKYLESLYS